MPARCPRHGECSANEDGPGPGVGSLVGPSVVKPRHRQQVHGGKRRAGEKYGQGEDPAEFAPEQLHDQPKHHRPQDVELLLDGQRPQMVERSGAPESLEIGDTGLDRRPVAHVEHCGKRLGQPRVPLVGLGDGGSDQNNRQQQHHSRQQAAGPPNPEILEVDLAGPAPGPQQNAGNQVAAEGKEHANTEEAALHVGHPEVVPDDGHDAERAQPVQPGHIGTGLSDRAGHELLLVLRLWQHRCKLALDPRTWERTICGCSAVHDAFRDCSVGGKRLGQRGCGPPSPLGVAD